jgi:DNA-binding CsgD family transcriptional regulator
MGWVPPPLPGRLSLEGEPPFVGRRAELDLLEQTWAAVEAERRQAVFIGGEPGAGKTRLAAEVAAALHRQGVGVLYGTSFLDYGTPYQPLVECLDLFLARDPTEEMAALIPDSARHLVRLCPRIAVYRSDLKGVDSSVEDRGDLFVAFRDFLRSLSAEQPLALILEDMHWALEPTRQLLAYLIQTTDQDRVLLLVTYRSTAPDRSDDLTRLIADLFRLPGVHRIDLAGLNAADITEYVMVSRGGEVSDARRSAAMLRDQTGGNPFFIRELLTQDSGGPLSRDSLLPATVIDALGSRLDTLPVETGDVVELAAIMGDEFDLNTLVHAVGDSDRVLGAVDEATNAGLTVRQSGRTGGYRFTHSLTREAVMTRMPSARKAEAHATAARAIENVWPDTGTRHAVLAHHYLEAGVLGFLSKGATQAVLAARHAETTLAYEDAAAWFGRAAVHGDPSQREEWELAAAHNLVRAGDLDAARDIYRDLVPSDDPRTAAEAAIGFEDASWRGLVDGLPAVALIDQALLRVENDPKDPLYVLLLSRKGRALGYAGRHEGEELAAKAVALADAIGDPSLMGSVLGANLYQLPIPDRIVTTVERNRRYLELARASGSQDELAYAAGLRANFAYLTGDPDALEEAWVVFTQSIAAGRLSYWHFLAETLRWGLDFMKGDLASAEGKMRDFEVTGPTFGQDFAEGQLAFQRFMLEREMGRLEAVRPVIEAVNDPERQWKPGLLALYAEFGMLEQAANLLPTYLQDVLDRPHSSWDWPAVLALGAEAVISVGDREYAEPLRPVLAEYSGLNLFAGSFTAVFGAADRYIAQIDSILGLDSADDHYESALDMDRRMGSTLHEVETLIAYAAHLDRTSDHRRLAQATEYRKRARDIAERKGLVRQLRRLDEATSLRSDRPAGLTHREIEVLRLIADGMSNKEIADRLFMSQNTAANHIRSILMKTQAGNRTKAAIFAADKGLLD